MLIDTVRGARERRKKALFAACVLIWFALVVAIGCVAIHFIVKFW